MNNYEKLLQLGCFSRKELAEITGNLRTADSVIYAYRKKNLIIPVKRNLYVTRSQETGGSVLNPFEVACHITPTAYICRHSAFEYYGMQNQVFNEIYVASKTQFHPFVFEGRVIKYIRSPFENGVTNNSRHLRITNLERTVVDEIKAASTEGQLEELFYNLRMLNGLDFEKVKDYLQCYNNCFLYQKTGYFMELFQEQYYTPKDFLSYCKNNIGICSRYLGEQNASEFAYVKDWNLYITKQLGEKYNV